MAMTCKKTVIYMLSVGNIQILKMDEVKDRISKLKTLGRGKYEI